MNRIRITHRIRRSASVLAALAGALLAVGTLSPPAFAYRVPPVGGPAGPVTVPPQLHHVIVSGGMPGWQITLIAAGAALAAAAVALLLDHARKAHKTHATTA